MINTKYPIHLLFVLFIGGLLAMHESTFYWYGFGSSIIGFAGTVAAVEQTRKDNDIDD